MKKRFISLILLFVMLFSLAPSVKAYAAENSGVEAFVTRLYQVCLDRKPDKDGLNDWVNQLKNGKTGGEVAYGFVFSKEFKNKKLSNADFVEYMYSAFFGRKSDAAGKKYWVDQLDNGATKGHVFDGFIGSAEFKKLCAKYGIEAGNMNYEDKDFKVFNEQGAKDFVTSFTEYVWIAIRMRTV